MQKAAADRPWATFRCLFSLNFPRLEYQLSMYPGFRSIVLGGSLVTAVNRKNSLAVLLYIHLQPPNWQKNINKNKQNKQVQYTLKKTRMWANAQPDGRPAEHRWRPLFNAPKFG